MGIFGLPNTNEEREEAIKVINEFADIRQKLMDLVGDDVLWDHLNIAEERAKELLGFPRSDGSDEE